MVGLVEGEVLGVDERPVLNGRILQGREEIAQTGDLQLEFNAGKIGGYRQALDLPEVLGLVVNSWILHHFDKIPCKKFFARPISGIGSTG